MHVLHLLARGRAMVPHYGALDASPRRFVGRQFDAKLADKKKQVAGGWVPVVVGEEVHAEDHHLAEYARECREGSLWPGDKATAELLGVSFDPNYGGEYADAE